jgi:hypothetical protein
MHDNFALKKKYFFSSILQKFSRLEKYSSWKINHFIFQKFIPRIYDVVHYKHFFRDHNNLVILKKRKKFKKKMFFFINISQIFTTRKILKMENKHPEHFWSA